MEEIKKFLRLMSKEELVSLCASMMFTSLVNAVELSKALATYDKASKEGPGF
jgi:hypothetical protein